MVAAVERNQRAAIVVKLGDFWLVRRLALGRLHKRERRKVMLAEAVATCRAYGVTTIVVEERGRHQGQLSTTGLCFNTLSLAEVKALFLPLARSGTNRELYEAVADDHSVLARYTFDRKTGVRSFGEQDRWR